MLTIDSQVHVYERNHPGRPWAGFLHGPAEVTGDDMVAAMDAVGAIKGVGHMPQNAASAAVIAAIERLVAEVSPRREAATSDRH